MKEFTTNDLESRLYEFISLDKQNLGHYSYILEFINYLIEQEDGKN